MKQFSIPLLIILVLSVSCTDTTNKSGSTESITEPGTNDEPPPITYTVLNALPHDTNSYTEGLLLHNGKLFESSGAPKEYDNTRSVVGIVDPATGKIAVKAELDRKTYFGEG